MCVKTKALAFFTTTIISEMLSLTHDCCHDKECNVEAQLCTADPVRSNVVMSSAVTINMLDHPQMSRRKEHAYTCNSFINQYGVAQPPFDTTWHRCAGGTELQSCCWAAATMARRWTCGQLVASWGNSLMASPSFLVTVTLTNCMSYRSCWVSASLSALHTEVQLRSV